MAMITDRGEPFVVSENYQEGSSCCRLLQTTHDGEPCSCLQRTSTQKDQLRQLLQRRTLRPQQRLDGNNGTNDSDESDAVAHALTSLSMKQREQIFQEIHGIVQQKPQDENAELVSKCLIELDKELGRQSRRAGRSTCAYEQARKLSPTYVQDRDFRLMFLRAVEFDPSKAAQRMVAFLEQKLNLFGPDKLTRDITLQDLDEENDMECLECGLHQTVPMRDRSGRKIVFHMWDVPDFCTARNLMRAVYYFFMSMVMGDPTAQKLGFVEITCNMSWSNTFGSDARRDIAKGILELALAIPYRLAAMHGCTTDPSLRVVVDAMRHITPAETLSRIRIHCGKQVEVFYKLQSYGIPIAALPINFEGEWNNDYHRKWLQKQRDLENAATVAIASNELQSQRSSSRSTEPSSMTDKMTTRQCDSVCSHDTSSATVVLKSELTASDVLIGRGRFLDTHPGNIWFRNFVAQHVEQYELLPKHQKRDYVTTLLQILRQDHSVRFLKQRRLQDSEQAGGTATCSVWDDATEDTEALLEKISRTLRRLREADK